MTNRAELHYRLVDQLYQAYLEAHQDMADRWLLEQTLYTGGSRRATYGYASIPASGRLLDMGTGFGALALDLVGNGDLELYAVDEDPEKLSVAQAVAEQISRVGQNSAPAGRVQFQVGDIYQLPYDDGFFDYIVGRFLFQHLLRPGDALKEIMRVLKPGGTVCLIDIDDNLAIVYPPTPGFKALHRAFSELQRGNGGDREIGRKLSVLLQESGFCDVETDIYMQAQHALQRRNDFGHQFVVRRFEDIRKSVIERNIMSGAEYDEHLRLFAENDGAWEFTASGQVVARAKRPLR